MLESQIQRRRENGEYLETLDRAIRDLDRKRDPNLVNIAGNNYLFALLREGKVKEVATARHLLPYPENPAHRAIRNAVEGCIEIALCNLSRAEELLVEAVEELTALQRPADARIAFMYLALVRLESGDLAGASDYLKLAGQIGRRHGFAEAEEVLLLAERLSRIADGSGRIRKIAFDAGGCLGPS